MYTLLVIDMQKGFLKNFNNEDNKQNVIRGCQRAVLKAIADGAEIIDVNYRGSYGPTIPEIKNLWKKYGKLFKNNVRKVVKSNDGGGKEIMTAKPANSLLVACGINLGACVKSTVFELQHMHKQDVKIIKDAVANAWGGEDYDIPKFQDILI